MQKLSQYSNNTTQRNATQRNATQHNAAQRNATQHNTIHYKQCDACHVIDYNLYIQHDAVDYHSM